MRLDDYNEKNGKRVWLTNEEIEALIGEAETDIQEIAFKLGAMAGLRRSEITSVTGADFQHGPDGFVRVWADYAKRDTYREAPIPDDLQSFVRGLVAGGDASEPVVDVDGSTVYRWARRAADRLEDRTGDRGWSFLNVHDLRRSWGGHLLWDCGVSPMVVMQFGGWSDWSTFEDHYMGEMTPEARDRERAKIDFVGGEPESEAALTTPQSPAARQAYGGQQ